MSAGAWVRGLSRFPIQLPHEIEEKLGSVEEFYKGQHSGRKLNFHPLLSHGTLTFQSKLGKYELEVSAMQLAILQCWNRRPNAELSIEELVLGKFPKKKIQNQKDEFKIFGFTIPFEIG